MSGLANPDLGLQEEDLKVFVGAVTHYFSHLTGEPAEIIAAYLGESSLPAHDFTGMIQVSGLFRGYVYFSASRNLMRKLLVRMMEPNTNDDNILDAVGEIANTISGNVRKHFGSALVISVPTKLKGEIAQIRKVIRTRPFVIQLSWKHNDATVLIDLEREAAH